MLDPEALGKRGPPRWWSRSRRPAVLWAAAKRFHLGGWGSLGAGNRRGECGAREAKHLAFSITTDWS